MKFGVVVFPGSNCDRDCFHVVSRVVGEPVEYVWHGRADLGDVQCVVVPGGFSWGDYLRAGAIAKLSPVMEAVGRFAANGGPVIGICNGFQVLLEAGLLPGALVRNDSLQYVCKDVYLRTATTRTPFTSTLDAGQVIELPVGHAEGRYVPGQVTCEQLRRRDQVVFEYCSAAGDVGPADNPNGSAANVAGVCNRRGNVVGLMPHPERAAEQVLGHTDGRALFEGVVRRFERRRRGAKRP